eukprot:366097-Chlamydomonas_euryale.AAC.28
MQSHSLPAASTSCKVFQWKERGTSPCRDIGSDWRRVLAQADHQGAHSGMLSKVKTTHLGIAGAPPSAIQRSQQHQGQRYTAQHGQKSHRRLDQLVPLAEAASAPTSWRPADESSSPASGVAEDAPDAAPLKLADERERCMCATAALSSLVAAAPPLANLPRHILRVHYIPFQLRCIENARAPCETTPSVMAALL